MGKSKKLKISKISRNGPLDEQIMEDGIAKSRPRVELERQKDDEFVDDKLSKRILEQAREQQEEMKEEFSFGPGHIKNKKCQEVSLGQDVSFSEPEDVMSGGTDFLGDIEITDEDEKALQQFMNKDASAGITLADIIKEKLTEKETELQSQFSDVCSVTSQNSSRLVPLYRGVGQVLAHYRSGKLPKPFKTIPQFQNWEEVLYWTQPDNWSSAAMYQATRIFASNLKGDMAKRFYNFILLPRIRDEIVQCKKLNFHLYEALKKSLFKPGAFYKGIILPLCESGTCTLREASIIGSVIAKHSIPVLYSSAAIIKISDMDYNGANSIFLRILLEKKYALPFRVIDAVVAHFLRFSLDKRELPLLWHQCLLTFAQLYKKELSAEQLDGLLNLLSNHFHVHVTPEIRRELCSKVDGPV